MKKALSFLLVFLILLTSGCADKPSEDTEATDPTQESSWEADNFLAKGQTATETVGELTANTDHEIVIESAADSLFDGVQPLSTAKWSIVSAPEGTAALQRALNAYNDQISGEIRASMKEIADYAKEDLAGGAHLVDPYEIVETTSVCRNDSEVVCFKRDTYSYSGGAHGMETVQGDCFDSKTGERLALADVLVNPGELAENMIELLEPRAEEKELYEGWQDVIRKEIAGEDGMSIDWTLDETGISFFFQPYDLAPYAAGVITFTLGYEGHEDIFVPRFIVAQENKRPTDPEDIRSDLRRTADGT